MTRILRRIVAACTAVALAGCTATAVSGARGMTEGREALATPRPATPPYLGVYEPAEAHSYRQVSAFGTMAGHRPGVVLYYDNVGEMFPAALVARIYAHGAIPFAQISPKGVTMASIAAGEQDSWLRSYAVAVAARRRPFIVSFAAEMNGGWYPWGWHHTSPAVWISAWRHVVDVFRSAGARHVIWLWTISHASPASGAMAAWWPGSAYVTWVGVDGYYYRRTETFATVFSPSIVAIRKFTADPILLSETGIGQVAGQAKMMGDLFAGIRRYQLAGLVWFDVCQHGGFFHQCWRLEGHPAAIAAFRIDLRSMRKRGRIR